MRFRVPGNGAGEPVAVRHADTSGGYIIENQHEEDRMRDIHIGKRGPEAAGEEQPDILSKTVRFGQDASSASASSDPTYSGISCGAVRQKVGRWSGFVQKVRSC